MSVVIDLNLVCAICLQDGELRSVFDKDDQSELRISEKIFKCSELNLDMNSKLPDKICAKCHDELTVAFEFRQKCEAAIAVFSSIQQQEDALANFELEQQQIKIPSGLKIKRIQPESKTYILPVHVESITEDLETIDEEGEEEDTAAVVTEQTVHVVTAEVEPDDGEIEDTEDFERDEVEDEDELDENMEAIELDDYYESEEVLEDNYDQELVEIKVEAQRGEEAKEFDVLGTVIEEPETERELKPNVYIKQEVKDEDDDHVAEENMPPTQQPMSKRTRGRPKKSNGIPEEETNSASSDGTSKTNERLKQDDKTRSPNSAAAKKPLKPLAIVQRVRKRNCSSPDAKPNKICEICGNSYKYQHALNAHMRRHNNDRPFNCEFCDKAFVSAVELRRHMRVHTGQKPYACQYCDRRFSDFGSRIKHERTHTGERPYNCNTCGKAFAYAHVLSVHLRTHTGEKKFKCNQCGKGFTKKAYLKTHTEQHARSAALAKFHEEAERGEGEVSQNPLDRNEMTAIKNVGLEECIFTTEYIEEDEDTRSAASATIMHMNEEHLEEHEMDHIEESQIETIIDEYPNMMMRKTKVEELSDVEDIHYETVA